MKFLSIFASIPDIKIYTIFYHKLMMGEKHLANKAIHMEHPVPFFSNIFIVTQAIFYNFFRIIKKFAVFVINL